MNPTSEATTASTLLLPRPTDGAPTPHATGEPGPWHRPSRPITSRTAYAAAHVIPKVLADNTPGAAAELDWEHTLDE